MGCDNLHPALLKISALQIYEHVLSSGSLPEEWKIHKIVSIPNLTLIKNYRPISLLCMLSKILERIVYLSNRTHYVCLEGTNSSSLSVLSGVPQGSVLGPLLFLVYVNDITTPIVNSSIYIYADDTKLVKRIANAKDQADLQSDLDHLVIWCKDWNLSLNLDKCVYLHFGKTIPDKQYNLDSKLILTRDSHKDLGVTIQNSLSNNPVSTIVHHTISTIEITNHSFCNASSYQC